LLPNLWRLTDVSDGTNPPPRRWPRAEWLTLQRTRSLEDFVPLVCSTVSRICWALTCVLLVILFLRYVIAVDPREVPWQDIKLLR
jgi:hypothetical protein